MGSGVGGFGKDTMYPVRKLSYTEKIHVHDHSRKKINTCSVRQKSVLHWKKWPLQKKIHVQWGKKVCYTEKIPAHFLRKNSKWIKVLENTAYAKSPTTTCHAKVCYYWLANPKYSPLQDFTELSKDALMKICKAP